MVQYEGHHEIHSRIKKMRPPNRLAIETSVEGESDILCMILISDIQLGYWFYQWFLSKTISQFKKKMTSVDTNWGGVAAEVNLE